MQSEIRTKFFFHINYNNDEFENNKNCSKRGRLRGFSQVARCVSEIHAFINLEKLLKAKFEFALR